MSCSTSKFVVALMMLGAFAGCKKEIGVIEEDRPEAIELITPDLSNFEFEGGRWEYQDGVVARVGQGDLHDLWVKGEYGDFELELEYKIAAGSNSGVYIRCTDKADWMTKALEVQIHETGDGTVHGQCAGVYDCLSPNFIDVARMQVMGADGVTKDLPLVADKEFQVAGATVKILRIYKNLQKIERKGRVVVYEGSDTGWNPALNVSVALDGTEEKLLLEQDAPVKTKKGGLTLDFYSEKRIEDKDVTTPAGRWHSMKITVKDSSIKVVSEGKEVLDMDLDDWTEAGWNPQGTKNKYPTALKDMPRKGYIGLQDHGLPVWFRDIKLTPMDNDE